MRPYCSNQTDFLLVAEQYNQFERVIIDNIESTTVYEYYRLQNDVYVINDDI